MIRCPDCKMLNRVGSLHCGSCGQLLTGTEAAPEVQFKAPMLKPSAGEEAAGEVTSEEVLPRAARPDPGRSMEDIEPMPTQFGMPAEDLEASSPSTSHKTVMGMPVVRLDARDGEEPEVHVPEDATLRGRALSEALESATPSAQAPIPKIQTTAPVTPKAPVSVERPRPKIQTTAPVTPEPQASVDVSRPKIQVTVPVTKAASPESDERIQIQPLATTSEEGEPKRRPPSKTLFGMRAAELHLGLAHTDTSADAGTGPSLKEAFPAFGDTAELKAVRPLPDLGEPPPRKPRSSAAKGVHIQSVASVRGSGPGFAETAVIPAVGVPPAPVETTEDTADRSAADEAGAVFIPSSPLPPPDVVARAAATLGRVTPKRSTRAGATVSEQVAAVRSSRDSRWARGLRFVAGLCLIAASILPLSAAIWTRTDLWTVLVPVTLGAVGLSLAFPGRVPTLLALVVGLAGGALGVFTYLEVDLPFPDGIVELQLRYGLIMVGAVLLFVAGFVSLARSSTQPLAKPPSS